MSDIEKQHIESYFNGDTYVDIPPILSNIESTSKCNMKCKICLRINNGTDLSLKLFNKIFQSGVDLTGTWLHLRGEPLLYSNLSLLIYKVQENRGTPRLSTNGLLMSKDKAIALINAGLKEIVFSINAVKRITYKFLHGMDSLHIVEKAVDIFLNAREITCLSTKVQVQLVSCAENQEEILPFINHWANKGIDIIHIKPLYTRAGNLIFSKNPLQQQYTVKQNMRKPCYYLWRGLVVYSNGVIGVCCADFRQHLALGNLYDDSLTDIWRSDTLKQLRLLHLQKNLPKACMYCQENVDENCVPGSTPLLIDYRLIDESWNLKLGRSIYIKT